MGSKQSYKTFFSELKNIIPIQRYGDLKIRKSVLRLIKMFFRRRIHVAGIFKLQDAFFGIKKYYSNQKIWVFENWKKNGGLIKRFEIWLFWWWYVTAFVDDQKRFCDRWEGVWERLGAFLWSILVAIRDKI